MDCKEDPVEGICGSCSCTLPLMGEVVRALELGNMAGISRSDIVSGGRLTFVMAVSLPALYVELRMAMGLSTVTSVLLTDFCLY